MSTVKSIYLQHLNGTTPNATMDTNGNFTVGGTVSGASSNMFRNRIINGDMRIDQRNAGASVNNSSTEYTIDRFRVASTQASKFSVQRNAGSVTPPTGFSNYLGCTSLSSYSVLSTDWFLIGQQIEGYNIADLAWGTSDAKTVTLSFWVRSSLTGTFGGSLNNSGYTRCYPFSFTINSANTWIYTTITIAGDTTGTWLTDNGVGIRVWFNLGSGSSNVGTANAWQAASYYAPTGATSVVGTSGATFYITGVQFEVGTAATPFEFRPYGHELTLCQRYYNKSYSIGVVPGTNTSAGQYRAVSVAGAGWVNIDFPTEMRTEPTITPYNTTGTSGVYGSDAGNWTPGESRISTRRYSQTGGVTSGNFTFGHYTASAEL
jgi:hypothetical protein